MPRDTSSDQPSFHHCACCGVPLPGRFSPCPACHALPIDAFDAAGIPGERASRSRALAAPGTQLEALPAVPGLPGGRALRRPAQTKLSPYELIDEATFEPGKRRRRHPLALAAAALAALGVVYAGVILLDDDDASVDTPVTVFGTVHPDGPAQNTAQSAAQNAAPTVAAPPKPEAVVPQAPRPVVIARQQPEAVHAAPVAPPPVVATAPTVAPPAVVATAPNVAPPPVIATARTVAPPPVTTTAQTAAPKPAVATGQTVTPPAATTTAQTTAPPPAITTTHPVAPSPAFATTHPVAPPAAIATTQTVAPSPAIATTHTAAPPTPPSPAVSAPTPRGTAVASTNVGTDTTTTPLTQADKLRADAERNLKAARGYLQRGNLSATKARLAAAIAAQPDNRDARRLRAEVNTLEQQRDALLSLARGCGDVGHWDCASHNANAALQIDSSSKAARRLVALASHESAWRTTALSEETPGDMRPLLGHH